MTRKAAPPCATVLPRSPLLHRVHDTKAIKRLYAALNDRDGSAMAALYAPEARFSDPIFPDLKGPEVGAMWRMLCARANELRVEVRKVEARGGLGEAEWEARYLFGDQALPVRNVGQARFAFKDGLIVNHVDDWDFRKWAGQALGFKGKALGWSKPFHAQVSKQAREGLERFMAKELRAPPA